MKHFSKEEVLQMKLNWTYSDEALEKDFVFKDFSEAFAFMTRVALLCEKANHHPDWNNVYNKVNIRLNTHSEKAVTNMDIDLAIKIDAILEQ